MIETGPDGAYPHVENDDVVGAIYITLREAEIRSTRTYDDGGIAVDLDADGQAVGIEILL